MGEESGVAMLRLFVLLLLVAVVVVVDGKSVCHEYFILLFYLFVSVAPFRGSLLAQ